LYPDTQDKLGFRVILKADSGPGSNFVDLLACCRVHGFYIYPGECDFLTLNATYSKRKDLHCYIPCLGVPNTTQSTQETDVCYSLFKSALCMKLAFIIKSRIKQGKSVSFQPFLVELFVFGGVDPVSGAVAAKNVFEERFSRGQCQNAWSRIGAAPLTRACLGDPKVW
jgi:hypothetical protein